MKWTVGRFGIYGAFLGHQVAYVSIGGEHLEVLSKVLLDGLRLGRRLHDNEIGAQSLEPV